jgi:benzoyl-CoA reductase/2-hydroxyglutaryl-CoA dehydratase subunit BcrC/BadD/HgdB
MSAPPQPSRAVATPAQAEESLQAMTAHYEQPSLGAVRWKAAGGTVAGYFCDAMPRELIRAAGLFPYRVTGDGNGARVQAPALVDPFMQQPVVTPGFVWSSIEQLLDGRLSFLDYLIIPNGRKSIYAIFRYLETIRRAGLPVAVPRLHYLDKSLTGSPDSAAFDRRSLGTLRDQLETWSGTELDPGELARVVAAANEQRTLLAQLIRARAEAQPRVTGSEALAIIGSSQFMDYDEHLAALRSFLGGLGQRPARPPGVRVFLAGSPVDRPRLYGLIEDAGGNVVAEDHCWGARIADGMVAGHGDPYDALADRYVRGSFCSLRVPMAATVSGCAHRAELARPDAAICWVQSGDPARSWEAPEEVRAIRERGIPCLLLGGQDYGLGDAEAVRETIAGFLRDPAAQADPVAAP